MVKRKNKINHRAHKRTQQIKSQLLETSSLNHQIKRVSSIPNDELFVLDTNRDERGIRRAKQWKNDDLKKKKKKKKKGPIENDNEVRLVKKMMNNDSLKKQKKKGSSGGNVKTDFDLWNDNITTTNTTRQHKTPSFIRTIGPSSMAGTAPTIITNPHHYPKPQQKQKEQQQPTVAVDVALPGQSYRPDHQQHQDAIGEALAIELAREEAQRERDRVVHDAGMDEDTLAILVDDDDDEEEEDDDDEQEEEEEASSIISKKKQQQQQQQQQQKLTKSQRNKIRRIRKEQTELRQRQSQRKFLSSINTIDTIHKQLRQKETLDARRREQIRSWKEEASQLPLGKDVHRSVLSSSKKMTTTNENRTLHVPSLPVALSEEVDDTNVVVSLRKMKVKGSLVSDRVESMVVRGMVNKPAGFRRRVAMSKRRKIKVKGGGGGLIC